jgi:hypothetical protein
LILNNYTVSGWAGIAAGAPVAVGDQVVFGRIFAGDLLTV